MADDLESPTQRRPFKTTAAAVWAIGFLVYFFSQNLPNNSTSPDNTVSRTDIWIYLWENALTVFNPFDYSSADHSSGWNYLSQRIPFVLTAMVLWTAAWCLGRVAVRTVIGHVSLLRTEKWVIESGAGLSLLTLWILGCGLAGQLTSIAILLPSMIAIPVVAFYWWKDTRDHASSEVTNHPVSPQKLSAKARLILNCGFAAFVIHILLGGMTPPRDFDVREYHLQGPKEWLLSGQIEFLEHNVYTSFPFLSEMLSLGAMVLTGDWWNGAVAGKLTLTGFQLLSALAVFAICRRWAGLAPAYIAALALLSTPWIMRISIIAYAEGAITFYLISSLMVCLLAAKACDEQMATRLIAVAGFLAGSAMSAKYPGLLSVILPTGLFLLAACWQRTQAEGFRSSRPAYIFRNAAIFVVATSVAVGPWLIKNFSETGNPVYPLGYSVFGASDWNAEMDAKWKRAHSAPDHKLSAIHLHLEDVAIRSDWQSGFLFAFAVPAVLLATTSYSIRWLWLYTLWMLATWWAFTHRIDRFWVPLIPVLAVLSGTAWNISTARFWRGLVVLLLLTCCIFNYGFNRLPVVGFHGGLIELTELRKMPVRQDVRLLNQTLPRNAKVLMVGEAEVFDCEFSVIYNTVFDESIFQQWTIANLNQQAEERPMRSAEEIRATLNTHEVTHIYVNWSEILRYRLTYGFTKYVTPERFTRLVEAGVLNPGVPMTSIKFDDLSEQQQTEIKSWPGGPQQVSGESYWNNIVLYEVRQQN
ncbi:MAG: hypothetical protein WAO83_19460 [Fuerstiella sp.]